MYGPQRGFAQSLYVDQQATALAGMLANASDINLVDSAFIGNTDPNLGLMAGVGVQVLPTVASNRPGLNYDIIMQPLNTATDADFAGVMIRNQFMRTNSYGEACFFHQDMGNYCRRERSGARVWVRLEEGETYLGSDVYWIVRDTAGTGKLIGGFSAQEITGTATPTPAVLTGGTVNLNEVRVITAGGFDIGATPAKVSGLDFSTVATLADVVAKVQTALDTAAASTYAVAIKGSGITISTVATGADATLTFAVAPTTANTVDASAALALTQTTGGTLSKGSAGVAADTVKLSGARFCGSFKAGTQPCNNIALLELM